ncbi:class IV adenylate cyclase [Salinisphaera aquimarina]|uniref:Class IV adenylate cyclase n=1 Tax=Salinisphaera aquimarina TaxID=2094031 RepID=A0ABV7EWN5_9GAMM
MARNIEIKARIDDRESLLRAVVAVADDGPYEIRQHDTFFACAEGRLKLRDFGDASGELIFYRRADAAGPKPSFYRRTATDDPAGLRQTLADALGVLGEVIKTRMLFMAGRTRIHIDRVQGLGDFVELEVVLAEREPENAGQAEAAALMRALAIDDASLVEGAYMDLLIARRGP